MEISKSNFFHGPGIVMRGHKDVKSHGKTMISQYAVCIAYDLKQKYTHFFMKEVMELRYQDSLGYFLCVAVLNFDIVSIWVITFWSFK